MSELESIIIETQADPDAAVIWLHGLGADGSDFVPIIDQLQLPSDMAIRFIFPHAPVRPVTINQGYQMSAWYDISALSITALPLSGRSRYPCQPYRSSRVFSGRRHRTALWLPL